ncbi:MAG TPA: hypothetical protein VH253_13380, partial [Phycisphaerae bacterium]|nr:hypothetical protein [Phycisphaerae bacterium]
MLEVASSRYELVAQTVHDWSNGRFLFEAESGISAEAGVPGEADKGRRRAVGQMWTSYKGYTVDDLAYRG